MMCYCSLGRWTGFLFVIALPFLVVSLCEAASDSERFTCVLSLPNAYSKSSGRKD